MSVDCYCPYCGAEHEGHTDDYSDCVSYEGIEILCGECERYFEVDIEFEPLYHVAEPSWCYKRSKNPEDYDRLIERCKHSRHKNWWSSSFDSVKDGKYDSPCAIGGCKWGDKYEGEPVV